MELAARWTQITTFQKRKFTEKSQQPKTPTMLQGRWKDAVFVLIGEEKKSWRVSCCLCVLIIRLPQEGESFLLTWFCLLALLLLFFLPQELCSQPFTRECAAAKSISLTAFVCAGLSHEHTVWVNAFFCLFICLFRFTFLPVCSLPPLFTPFSSPFSSLSLSFPFGWPKVLH